MRFHCSTYHHDQSHRPGLCVAIDCVVEWCYCTLERDWSGWSPNISARATATMETAKLRWTRFCTLLHKSNLHQEEGRHGKNREHMSEGFIDT